MYIKVKVTPAAPRNALRRISSERFEISVRERPERNLANQRALELLADHLKVSTGDLRIISGHRSPSKIIAVRDRSPS